MTRWERRFVSVYEAQVHHNSVFQKDYNSKAPDYIVLICLFGNSFFFFFSECLMLLMLLMLIFFFSRKLSLLHCYNHFCPRDTFSTLPRLNVSQSIKPYLYNTSYGQSGRVVGRDNILNNTLTLGNIQKPAVIEQSCI